MSTLTDRYVWAVLRAAPGAQRQELEREIRALVADAIEAHRPNHPSDPDGAERAAVTELGDPTALAARYTERPNHLIGPTVFAHWQRLLTLLLPIVLPISFAVVLGANLIADQTVGQSIVAALGTAVTAAIQTVFWVTLVFAVIERIGATDGGPGRAWTPDDLPELPDDGRMPLSELVGLVVANALVAVGLLWMQLQPPIVLDGESFPLFDPALWSFWLPWFLGVAVAEILLAIVVFARGGWTYPLAAANALLGAAFAIPAVYLLQDGLLLNPDLVEAVRTATDATWLDVTTVIIAVTVVTITVWDAVDAFRKARRASRPALRGATT